MNYDEEKKRYVSFCGSYCHTCDWFTGKIRRNFQSASDMMEEYGFRKLLEGKVDIENMKTGLKILAKLQHLFWMQGRDRRGTGRRQVQNPPMLLPERLQPMQRMRQLSLRSIEKQSRRNKISLHRKSGRDKRERHRILDQQAIKRIQRLISA